MSGIGRHKLSDAIARPAASKSSSKRGKPGADPSVAAEMAREILERDAARNAGAGIRPRMVEIGRGNQQASRKTGV
jgi:hypothetical protein